RQPFAEPVARPPSGGDVDVDVAEVGQPDRGLVVAHVARSRARPRRRRLVQCPRPLMAGGPRRTAPSQGGRCSMPKVTFVNEKREIEVPEGSNLRQEARKAGIEVYKGIERYLNCRGLGLCGTCKVLVKKGMDHLNKKTLMERINMSAHPL